MEKKEERDIDISISKKDTDWLKGFFSLWVLIHHLYQETNMLGNTIFASHFRFFGFLAVVVFFFLTGYGLIISYKTKGASYLTSFPRARILSFYVKILIFVIIYTALNYFLTKEVNYRIIVSSMLLGQSVIRNGWYLQVALFMYLLYYVIFKLIDDDSLRVVTSTVGIIGYSIWCIEIRKSGIWWYESNFAFITGILYGMICSKKEQKISKKKFARLMFSVTTFFVISYTLLIYCNYDVQVRLILKWIISCTFPVVMIFVCKGLDKKIKLFHMLSKISLEVYVSQGIFLTLFHSCVWNIENIYLYIVMVCAATIVFSIVLHYFFQRMNRHVSKKYLIFKLT